MNDEAPSSILDNSALYEGTYLEFLGFKLVDWKDGYARLEMLVRSDHRNTVGFLHGGVISSLLDMATFKALILGIFFVFSFKQL